MKAYFFLLSFIFLAYGCSPVKSNSQDERHQAELTLHEVKTKVDDFNHDLSCYKTEIQILESKLKNQEDAFEKLQDKMQTGYLAKVTEAFSRLQEVEKKTSAMEKQTKEAITVMKDLAKNTDEAALALNQYHSKISELEKSLSAQNLKLEEVKKIKNTLEEIILALKTEEGGKKTVHRVQAGESLEKIAKKYSVSLNQLKKLNHLDEDLIMIGQELKIPAK